MNNVAIMLLQRVKMYQSKELNTANRLRKLRQLIKLRVKFCLSIQSVTLLLKGRLYLIFSNKGNVSFPI